MKGYEILQMEITRRELQGLLFWAGHGIGMSRAGSYPETTDTINRLKYKHKIRGSKAIFGRNIPPEKEE